MTISKFCFSKFFALCCLCFVFTVFFPLKSQAADSFCGFDWLDGWNYGGGDPLETQCYNSGGTCYDSSETHPCKTEYANCIMPTSGTHPTLGVDANQIIADEAASGGYTVGDFAGAYVILVGVSDGAVFATCHGNSLIPNYTGTHGLVRHQTAKECYGAMPTCTLSAPLPVIGTCGTANGGTFASAPTTNLCNFGNGVATPAPSGSGPWTWTCGGLYGGASSGNCTATQTTPPSCVWTYSGGVSSGCGAYADCSSNTESAVTGTACSTAGAQCFGGNRMMCTGFKETCVCSTPVNGTCGTSNGGTFASAPTTNLCGNGNGVATPAPSGSGPWTWTCGGSGGGSSSGNCTATQTAPVVNGSCSATPGVCTAGSVASDNGLTSCGTTRTWDCTGSGGGTTSNCSVANAACVVNGSCSATPGVCTAGSVAADNGLTSCGTTRTWNCNGSGGGTNAPCTYNNAVCVVNGSCGAANGVGVYSAPSSGLCGAGSATAVSGSGPFTWSCNGAGGGTNAACSAPLAQNGACGSSHGGNFYVAPAAGLCSVGTASAVGGTGPWTWTCTGVSGGTTANCSANLSVNGSCGAANGVGATSAPSSGLCGAGSATAVAGTGPWTWSCNGSNGGTNAACSAPVQVNGTCGAANGVGAYSAPSSGLCGTGTATAVAGSGPFTWSCNGANGGSNAACSAPLRTDGVCGASHNGNFYVAPAAGLCSAGTASGVAGTGPWTWTCAGTNGGLTAACNANKSVNGVCGTANGVSTATAPTNPDLCSAGNDTAVTNSSNTWNWGCNGVNGGTNATCSAPERINGTCGPANGSSVYTAPSSGLCATGNSTSVTGSGPFDWNCNGVNGGTNASCSANLTVNGQCGPAHGAFSATTPSSGLCSAGSAGAVAGTGPFTWTCSGLNGGTAVGCSSQVVVQGTCGPSNNVPTSTAPAAGLCATGTATAITGTGPWAWSCTGTGGGITSTCTAPTPPPPPSFGGACPA